MFVRCSSVSQQLSHRPHIKTGNYPTTTPTANNTQSHILSCERVLNPIKRRKTLLKLRREGAQEAFLQEAHFMDVEHVKMKRGGFKHVFSSSSESGRGASLISHQTEYEHISEMKDKGRHVMVVGRMEGLMAALFHTYAPPGTDWSFHQSL